ncbi:uncharacterized protein [Triticum aestivum]|uniref:uncharacterized protein n=1 Tax=Triticum aestivum TaxID=4565 RepID=UPI001D00B85D|nr:uncharacterized protein LOC123095846 [Triticum aestivum]
MFTCHISYKKNWGGLYQDVNMDGSLTGCALFGSSTTTLSAHNEEKTAITVAVGGNEPSGRYILVAGRSDEKDGVRLPIPVGVLKPAITYRVAGWISLGGAGAAPGTSHPVRIHLDVDENGSESQLVEYGAVCTQEGARTEIMGAFRLRTEPRSAAAVCVHGAPAGVDVKVMDLRVSPVDHKARFRQLKDKTDKRDVILKVGAGAAAASVRVV